MEKLFIKKTKKRKKVKELRENPSRENHNRQGIVLDEEPAKLSFLGLLLFLRGITGVASLSIHGRRADE
ncbi:hypothetical protein TNCV_4980211 [Trichonephila clavipes]|nr:hypothetical protein TNCV_4980211 [Trichonephila clavipes]